MITAVIIYAMLLLLWLGYITVMSGLREWSDLHLFAKINLIIPAAAFLLLDVLVNLTIGSLLFLERPRWWTLSERLHYHATRDHGWKTYLAAWLCKNLLNPFDPDGHHCGRK